VGNGIAPQCARAAKDIIMKNNDGNRIEDPFWATQADTRENRRKP
jgi:hypothetical protein